MTKEDQMVFHVCKDPTVNTLLKKISNRAIHSNLKHGNTINNVHKPTLKWLQESLEEAIDLCVYLQRAIEEENAKEKIR
tara:strand:- start:321 stop:557 length:237 start_codon:yes stop_codon:yes gene_type:complete